MRHIRKEDITPPFTNSTGEIIFEMIGAPVELGGTTGHSVGHVVIPVGASSRKHYHPIAEETYYILKGEAKMVVNDKEMPLKPGDTVLIEPTEWHRIFQSGSEDLEFLVICSPAWDPQNSVYED